MPRHHPLCALLLLGVLAAALPAAAQTLSDPNLELESSSPGLNAPVAIRFLGDDDAFVLEKNTGKVQRLQGGALTEVLDLTVSNNNERGLLGIELHPDFDTNGWVYLYYSERNSDRDGSSLWLRNQVSRFTWDGASLGNEERLFAIEPDPNQENGPNHNGGPMRFGTDGKLYLATGDLNRERAEQNHVDPMSPPMMPLSAGAGGIYRLNDDGTVPMDNPFVSLGGDFAGLYAYGVRNSFGMAFDPVTNELWDTENGPGSMDEINLVPEGFNSGWEILMGPDSRDMGASEADLLDLLPGVSVYSDPEFSYDDTIGVTAIAFLAGSALGAGYDDAVLVGDNNNGALYLYRLNDDRDGFDFDDPDLMDLVADSADERNRNRIGTGFGVVTDIEVGPDGLVTVVSISGDIHEISLVPEPGTAGTLGLGLAALAALRRRRQPA